MLGQGWGCGPSKGLHALQPLPSLAQTATKGCVIRCLLDAATQLLADTNPPLSLCGPVRASAPPGLHSPVPLLDRAPSCHSHLSHSGLILAGSASSVCLKSQGLEQCRAHSRYSLSMFFICSFLLCLCKTNPLHFYGASQCLITASCTMLHTSLHSSSGTFMRSNPLNLFVTSTVS